ncbi:type II toxin-antitoxin system RelE/ParE family toxin [Sulfuricurvum sp.]|uniref:type II toxin-antitoxin system RelE/ParE family toxin n=1 Tax=Sulfuricurvum sp. TaxID=2025608 RepID=UPI002632FD73|nr:type II toxin-antitoxin system RelE/ParE family toxin [Sulfuricurvum sp.]MDD2780165.1 type II toxin-antitoxin system RelE/ParE family toxin [Sulfuricurvum sp.]
MNITAFSVFESSAYQHSKKQLKKRFRLIDSDVTKFLHSLESVDDLGISLGDGIYKVRIANSDKNKGKSAGYRLITLLKVIESNIYLIYIYDKSDFENITEKELDEIIQGLVGELK